MTIIDVLAIILVLFFLAYLLLPYLARDGIREGIQTNCVHNLMQVNLAFRIWEGDHNNEYPTSYAATNGTLEWPTTTNLAIYFQAMSNELATPRLLICPADVGRLPATNWTTDFNNSHISYFLNLDAGEAYPQEIMMGDDNFAIGGVPVKSGFLLLSSNAPISYTAERHRFVGNIGFADGSVAEESSLGLQSSCELSVRGTPVTTNRIVIP